MSMYHEMDDHGNHRIVVGEQASEWVTYQSLPRLEVHGTLYAAASAYWDGILPIEKVFVVAVVSHDTRSYRGRGENEVNPNYSDADLYSGA